MCNKCKNDKCKCYYQSTDKFLVSKIVEVETEIEELATGGISAYQSALRTGKIPAYYSEADFVEWLKSTPDPVEPSENIAPVRAEDIFNI